MVLCRLCRLASLTLMLFYLQYITLDDIMDLMGSDAAQSEDAMRQMWGDSIKAVKCQHARITYDDFLLLMKGQTKETPSQPTMKGPNMILHVVPETEASQGSDVSPIKTANVITLPSGDTVGIDGMIKQDNKFDVNGSNHTPVVPPRQLSPSTQSAPTTPVGHKLILDSKEVDGPLSMDEDDDILSSGPGVPGSLASLTPPSSPHRGAEDYITPRGPRRSVDFAVDTKKENLMIPGLPTLPMPEPYTRRRSRSAGDKDEADEKDLHVVADAVRDMLLPETDDRHHHREIDDVVKDQSESALKVNRKLYRAHRQMRLAVLDASKRFEEQQARRAREVLLAQCENDEKDNEQHLGMIHAGLVMRHGHKQQVSSEAIRQLLKENQEEQQALVEKATRRGGRGRASRKKTISDMSGMLASLGQEEMGILASRASEGLKEAESPQLTEVKSADPAAMVPPQFQSTSASALPPVLPDLTGNDGAIREPTVPGEFRSTTDPFSKEGKYGALQQWK